MTRSRGSVDDDIRCAHRGCPRDGTRVFMLTGEWRVLRCALRNFLLLRRSEFAMLTIGIVFVAIVYGPILPIGPFPPRLFWQLPRTYIVPCRITT